MGSLVDVLVGVFVLAAVLVPLFNLSSGAVAQCEFTLERRQACALAFSLIERFRGEGLGTLLGSAVYDAPSKTYVLANAHEVTGIDPSNHLRLDRVVDGNTTLESTIIFTDDVGGQDGLGCLESTVTLRTAVKGTRAMRETSVSTFRLVLNQR